MQQALEASVQLHLFPKAAVDVFCIVLEAAGGEVAAAITAASLALADAGIPLYDLVPACAVVSLGLITSHAFNHAIEHTLPCYMLSWHIDIECSALWKN